MSGRRYRAVDSEVRAAAVERVAELMSPTGGAHSRTAAARLVAADLGVHYNSVLNWVSAHVDATPTGDPLALVTEIQRLRSQLAASQELNRQLVALKHPEATG